MKAKLTVDQSFTTGKVDDRIFGGFVEHIGRCVYDGIYEPGHPEADADGFRNDVAGLVRDLDMPVTRYPGGNFVSGYDWLDTIGPKDQRPVRVDYAWEALEPNQVGIDEFVKWCRKANTTPLMTVNLGTNTARAAQELVEYCNFPGNSAWSELRKQNGADQPHNIKLWCLGNEMDGEWQIGHKTAAEYARIARESAKMMKMVDPSIELIVCGSSTRGMPTYGEWDATVLDETFDVVEYLALHAYYGCYDGNRPLFLASPEILDWQIATSIAICDFVAAKKKSHKKLNLAVDEWNVWYRGNPKAAPETIWQVGRPINEETYDMTDVLVVGGLIATMLNHADRVKIGCIAQSVNIIAPIMTRKGGGVWKQTIYYPFLYMSKYGRGTVLTQHVESPDYRCESPFLAKPVPYLLSTVILNEEADEIRVFALNRSLDEAMDFQFAMTGFRPVEVVEAVEIHHPDLNAVNTETEENVRPAAIPAAQYTLAGTELTATLKPASWNMFRIRLQ